MEEKTIQQMTQIGAELRHAQSETGISARLLSRALGIDYRTICKILKGKNANFNNYLRVLAVFGIELQTQTPDNFCGLKKELKQIARQRTEQPTQLQEVKKTPQRSNR